MTDGRGAFAMGTPEGLRTRKYHGFYLGIAGRAEAAFLADLEVSVNGRSLWPHRYRAEPHPVVDPDPGFADFRFQSSPRGPQWEWSLGEAGGILRFAVSSQRGRGIEMQWSWESSEPRRAIELKVRPFFAMRSLHATGGAPWRLEREKDETSPKGWVARIKGDIEGGVIKESVFTRMIGAWDWTQDPQWYLNFIYTEELERGYPAEENLFAAGFWSIRLKNGETGRILISTDLEGVSGELPRKRPAARDSRLPALDFVLTRPPGIVAGYPWFGEWGRDTFIALPGLVMSWLLNGGKPQEVADWAMEVLARWGQWIQLTGMLPNLIEKNGSHQWESADATLWWTHALASLWSFSLDGSPAGRKEFAGLESRFRAPLNHAIEAIRTHRHLFLKTARDGALEVTEPHTTWMDARLEGCAVTPRVGRLPEINALWFQARCLQTLWSQTQGEEIDLSALEALGRNILDHRENHRPNFIFLHSIPLAPSFVLKDGGSLRRDLTRAETFWTPVGLRTLDPKSPEYLSKCVGTQSERDRAYHQGSVWGWLGGHFEMAKERAGMQGWEMFPEEALEQMPIEGHIPEIFDGEEPFTPRGAPAQAWSLACLEESRARKRLRVDAKLTELLARRWTGREQRRSRPRRSEVDKNL